jgi:hypothetical protein
MLCIWIRLKTKKARYIRIELLTLSGLTGFTKKVLRYIFKIIVVESFSKKVWFQSFAFSPIRRIVNTGL